MLGRKTLKPHSICKECQQGLGHAPTTAPPGNQDESTAPRWKPWMDLSAAFLYILGGTQGA